MWHVCNTLQEARKWSKARHYLKTELFGKHKPFYKVVAPSPPEHSPEEAQALLQSGGSPSPDKLLELAQVAEDSMLDAGSGKALSDFLVKNTSKRLLFYTLRWLGRCCGA